MNTTGNASKVRYRIPSSKAVLRSTCRLACRNYSTQEDSGLTKCRERAPSAQTRESLRKCQGRIQAQVQNKHTEWLVTTDHDCTSKSCFPAFERSVISQIPSLPPQSIIQDTKGMRRHAPVRDFWILHLCALRLRRTGA
jgi:hypothetical protein